MLKGKTALVTGSTSGIGLGIALQLARQGANILLNGFGDVEGAKAEVAKLGGRVSYHGADMSRPAEIEAMVRACEAEFGAIDILVNNAGIQHVAAVEDFPADRWDARSERAALPINPTTPSDVTRFVPPALTNGRSMPLAGVSPVVTSMLMTAWAQSAKPQPKTM